MKENKIRIVVNENAAIVRHLDQIAYEEGTSRADVIRRILRKALGTPTNEKQERPQ